MSLTEPAADIPLIEEKMIPFPKAVFITASIFLSAFFLFYLIVNINPFDWLGHPYAQLSTGHVYFWVIALFISTTYCYQLFSRKYIVYTDKVLIKSNFRAERILYFHDLLGWDEQTDDNGNLCGLKLRFKSRKIPIDSSDHAQKIIDHLVAQKIKNHIDETADALMYVKSVFFFLGSAFIILTVRHPILYSREGNKGDEKMMLYKMPMSQTPVMYRSINGNKHPGTMEFKLTGLDDYVFFLPNDSAVMLRMNNTDFLKYIYDTVNIEILKYDYEVKIAHSREPTFLDKHFDWNRVHMTRVEFADFSITSDPEWILDQDGDDASP